MKPREFSRTASPYLSGGTADRGCPRARAEYDARLGRLESSDEWGGVLGRVERTVRTMPLWKLQTVGSERLEFLYDDRESETPREITLKPGVAWCFR